MGRPVAALAFSLVSISFAIALPAYGNPPVAAPTAEQARLLDHCGTMAEAVLRFAEARDQGLSKPDAFKSVTHGEAAYVPGSLLDETLQWPYDHPTEQVATTGSHFYHRCVLDTYDVLNPTSDASLAASAVSCQKDHAEDSDAIDSCIDTQTNALVQHYRGLAPAISETPASAATPSVSTAEAPLLAVTPPAAASSAAPVSAPPLVATVPDTAAPPAEVSPPSVAAASVPQAAKPQVGAPPLVATVPETAAPPAEVAPPAVASSSVPQPTKLQVAAPRLAAVAPAPAAPSPAAPPVEVAPAPVAAPATPRAATALSVAGGAPASITTFGKLTLGMSIADARRTFHSQGDQDKDEHGADTYTYLVGGGSAWITLRTTVAHPDLLYGIQVAGGPAAKQAPVAGISLGDTARELLTHLGQPAARTPIQEYRTHWIYAGRNYSFEVSDGGDVVSMLIYGYVGTDQEDDDPDADASGQ